MSDMRAFLKSICNAASDFLDGKISAEHFVERYNDLVNDTPDEADQSGPLYKLLDEYLTQFSFFQSDPRVRSEHPKDLYGPEELFRKVRALFKQLQQL